MSQALCGYMGGTDWVSSHIRHLTMEVKLVSGMLAYMNHLMWLSAQDKFIERCRSRI